MSNKITEINTHSGKEKSDLSIYKEQKNNLLEVNLGKSIQNQKKIDQDIKKLERFDNYVDNIDFNINYKNNTKTLIISMKVIFMIKSMMDNNINNVLLKDSVKNIPLTDMINGLKERNEKAVYLNEKLLDSINGAVVLDNELLKNIDKDIRNFFGYDLAMYTIDKDEEEDFSDGEEYKEGYTYQQEYDEEVIYKYDAQEENLLLLKKITTSRIKKLKKIFDNIIIIEKYFQ